MKIKSILPIVLACILIAPRLSMASTDTIYGKWSNTIYRIKYANKEKADFSSNTLSASKWGNLEQEGAVFIPAAGCRWGTEANHTGSYGYYWSSTVYSNLDSCGVFFDNRSLFPQSVLLKEYGFSVRLVCPAE